MKYCFLWFVWVFYGIWAGNQFLLSKMCLCLASFYEIGPRAVDNDENCLNELTLTGKN